MTEAEINKIERANREAWIAQREARWETPLKPIEIVRAKLAESDLPFLSKRPRKGPLSASIY